MRYTHWISFLSAKVFRHHVTKHQVLPLMLVIVQLQTGANVRLSIIGLCCRTSEHCKTVQC